MSDSGVGVYINAQEVRVMISFQLRFTLQMIL